jgi:hypothetical protein
VITLNVQIVINDLLHRLWLESGLENEGKCADFHHRGGLESLKVSSKIQSRVVCCGGVTKRGKRHKTSFLIKKTYSMSLFVNVFCFLNFVQVKFGNFEINVKMSKSKSVMTVFLLLLFLLLPALVLVEKQNKKKRFVLVVLKSFSSKFYPIGSTFYCLISPNPNHFLYSFSHKK